MASVHFCVPAWLEIEKRLPNKGLRPWLARLLLRLGSHLEGRQLSSPSLRLIAPVSKGIGQAVRWHHRITAREVLLPNAYDEQRFSPAMRSRFRTEARRELGFGGDLFVFAFTSQGHYDRKGLWLVIEALSLVPAPWAEKSRLLVIGGNPAQIAGLRRRLAEKFPAVQGAICFAGHQPRVERYLAAADAFILPSYFEAFCLAEIEAAAMGIPLLLSKHHGVEMILKEGENGWLIQHQPSDIAAKMLRLMDGSWLPSGRYLGQALNRQEYADRVDRLYRLLLSNSSA
jgi:UDP-glucose:(heptosyl)LPS alpha-1,3-glucosyltransferase